MNSILGIGYQSLFANFWKMITYSRVLEELFCELRLAGDLLGDLKYILIPNLISIS
ncbi:hypothetical protein LEP1GSC125_1077 [Leptospira mayottensis 200901122]|uniref:Uncharacterized protein n=1 Tax=Leptospira mayottensis 200901122 TaxID=1193010 RepID=A0AA87MJF8_9LEPT|nr:hypothetical protein [Leptospira mayottensis]EKR98266.1 hypothetical protein LEP1GSC125_1077 [Leptospira mayottensis 200901122]